MTVTNDGNVGVGTTTPAYMFVVSSSVAFPGLTAESGASDDALCRDAANDQEIEVNTGATTCLLSTRRVKHDIQPLTIGIRELMQLKPVSYVENGTNIPNVGLVAEDVFEIEPRLVVLDDGGLPKTIKYENLGALIIKSLQEVWQKVLNHETRIEKLERENLELKSRIEKLEKLWYN